MTLSQTPPALQALPGGLTPEVQPSVLGITRDQLPRWADRLLTADAERYVAERWDPINRVFTWKDDDRVTMSKAARGRSADLSGMTPLARAEWLISVACDASADVAAKPPASRMLALRCTETQVASLCHLPSDGLALLPEALLRQWTRRLTLFDANPETEWDRDEVRLKVVKSNAKTNTVLRVGAINQSWLRDLLVDVLKVRLNDAGENTLSKWVIATQRVSDVLATRPDHGNQPSRLNARVMDQVVRTFENDSRMTPGLLTMTIKDFAAVLSSARALGFADRSGLPADFRFRPSHYPETTEVVVHDRGFPDATFRFVMGADDLFGDRVFELARSLPGSNDVQGDAFVIAIQLAANFGRRPEELCSLKAHRIRVADTGAAELLYDNFKSKRDNVWLPIDARSADMVARWVERLRAHYPDTPLTNLALFPRRTRNSKGENPMDSSALSRMWRWWATLLEQAIVIGHVVESTNMRLDQVVALTVADMVDGTLRCGDEHVPVATSVWQVLVDYRADLLRRFKERAHVPDDRGLLPLFPDPKQRPARGRLARYGPQDWLPVTPDMFDPLGEGWTAIAAQYPSGGIPGHSLGARRINPDELQVRLFRHTYLQHLVNLNTDIFLVQELADHANVQTTINSYVRVQDEKLREAVDQLAMHRMTVYGSPARNTLPLISAPTRDIGTNDCSNPQVLALGSEGCEFDRMCFNCVHLAADPSNIPDIKAEIRTCNLSLARLEAQADDDPLRPHHMEVLKARRDGWRRILNLLDDHLGELDPAEREKVETAATVVRDFRTRVRAGGINFGGAPA